jgi:4-methyl-5(b-hydroxyethyl)-thiazole monophosphate biosynthesis
MITAVPLLLLRRGAGRLPPGAAGPLLRRALATTPPPPTVLVPVADGSEEIETVCIVDTLVRAGAAVTLASVEPGRLLVTCSRGVRLEADAHIADCAGATFDAIALPGGMPGAEALRDDPTLTELLRAQHASERLVAAVCASPAVVLAPHGLLGGDRATCYPAPALAGAFPAETTWADARVVRSRSPRLITSQGVRIDPRPFDNRSSHCPDPDFRASNKMSKTPACVSCPVGPVDGAARVAARR